MDAKQNQPITTPNAPAVEQPKAAQNPPTEKKPETPAK